MDTLVLPGENAADIEPLLARLLAEEQPVGTLRAARLRAG